eukprot:m.704278 g.704278  ORF g.704278 m.704278 type:complete len:128 (+) comp58715_c0_seq29:2877-3260(+)
MTFRSSSFVWAYLCFLEGAFVVSGSHSHASHHRLFFTTIRPSSRTVSYCMWLAPPLSNPPVQGKTFKLREPNKNNTRNKNNQTTNWQPTATESKLSIEVRARIATRMREIGVLLVHTMHCLGGFNDK